MQRVGVSGSPIQPGKTVSIFPMTTRQADTYTSVFAIDSSGLLISLWVDSIVGNLDINVYTVTEEGRDLLVMTIPTITAASTQLQLEQVQPPLLSNIKIVATTTGSSAFELRARAVPNPGELANQHCHRILETILVETDGTLLIEADACVLVTVDRGHGHQLDILPFSTSRFT